jgi:hypothetical protein
LAWFRLTSVHGPQVIVGAAAPAALAAGWTDFAGWTDAARWTDAA